MKHEVICLRLDDKGRGITKINEKITFVPELLPPEKAIIKITKNKKKYAEGQIIKLLTQSPNRITPKCPYNYCGCQLKHLEYKKELEYKQNKVREILKKFGEISPKINNIVYDNTHTQYRNKITLKVKNKVGYYINGTNEFLPITKCQLVSDKINQIIDILNKEDLSKVEEIVIKEFDEIMLIIKGTLDITNIKNI